MRACEARKCFSAIMCWTGLDNRLGTSDTTSPSDNEMKYYCPQKRNKSWVMNGPFRTSDSTWKHTLAYTELCRSSDRFEHRPILNYTKQVPSTQIPLCSVPSRPLAVNNCQAELRALLASVEGVKWQVPEVRSNGGACQVRFKILVIQWVTVFRKIIHLLARARWMLCQGCHSGFSHFTTSGA